jgi:hypothetical protein
MPTSLDMSHPAAPKTSPAPGSSNGNGSAATADDRRRSEPRILCDREISILTLEEGAVEQRFVAAHLTDCSEHGLGMTLSEPVKAGKQLLVRMNMNKMVLLVYTLKYCIPTQASQFRAGARFTGYAASTFQEEPGKIVSALTGEN